MTPTPSFARAEPSSHRLLQELNTAYLAVHTAKENAFWEDKMGLATRLPGAFERHEIAYQQFSSDARWIERLRQALDEKNLAETDRVGLSGWRRFFEAHAIEGEEAKALQSQIVGLEAELAAARGKMNLSYRDPHSGETVAASSVKLGLLLRTSPDVKLREAAFRGLQSIETYVLEHGFLEIVKARNRLGRLLGYEDYYDYKVTRNEGFSKRQLFSVLDELEQKTRSLGESAVATAEREHGPIARQGFGLPYLMSGDVTRKLDPYFGFDQALMRWGVSFANLGIRYRGATLTLDLLDRQGKYENGFMHGPMPAFVDQNHFRPARINFTANAIVGQIGSGHRATETLFHEGGHAAHFSNIQMPAPCFSQEYAPTSVALAETQSMFLDSFIETPAWMARYALNAEGESIPPDLLRESLTLKHPWKAFQIRAMLTICYAEKAIYELPENELTSENVIRILRGIEQKLQFTHEGVRPVLSVPHLLAGESSAYYHGYVLAEMAVQQTRRFFLKRDGVLVDNPAVGRDLAEHYWQSGNRDSFFNLVQNLTGEAFSADALVEEASKSLAQVLAAAESALAETPKIKERTQKIDLDAHIRVMHGDTLIADNSGPEGFEGMARQFSEWLKESSVRSI